MFEIYVHVINNLSDIILMLIFLDRFQYINHKQSPFLHPNRTFTGISLAVLVLRLVLSATTTRSIVEDVTCPKRCEQTAP